MTRILLDECLPVKPAYRFQETHESFVVSTVTDQKWNGLKNGDLLKKALQKFDIIITIDQKRAYQQSIAGLEIAVIALQADSNRYQDLVPFIDPAVKVIKDFKPGRFYFVSL
jgi:hypothetical protein